MEPGSNAGGPAAMPQVQVRQATILRCDIVGSTHIKKRLDLEGVLGFKDAWEALVTDVTGRHGGHVETFEGDGALVVFGYPEAREDMVESAVQTGLALVQAVRGMRIEGADGIEVRVGIASGPVATLNRPATAKSEAVASLVIDVSERLRALAAPGQVVVADATRKLAGRFFDYEDLGIVAVKGFEEGVHAWRVVGPSAVLSRFEAQRYDSASGAIVGRDPELAALAQAWADARAGHGRAVCLLAEAGMGKSRLAHAILAQAAKDGAAVLEIDCTPSTGNTPLFPIGVLLRRTAGIGSATPEAEKRALAAQLLRRLLGPDTDALLYLAPLFGLEGAPTPQNKLPAETRDRTITTVLTMLRAFAADRPVAILCEDLHWIDHTTGEVLSRVTAEIAGLPALMIVTTRPTSDPLPLDRAALTTLELSPLAPAQAAELVRALAQGAMPSQGVAAIVERCEGVPLVLEEVTRNAVDVAHRAADSAPALQTGSTMPTPLEIVVQARLARTPELLPLVQAAAVLGRDFSRVVLERMVAAAPPAGMSAAVARLAELGLLDAPVSAADARLRFRHVMIMEAVYNTLLGRDRAQLHSHAADTLRDWHRGSPDGADDVVAEHLRKARRFREAIELRLAASANTAARGAYVETQGHCEAALALVDELEPGRDRTLLHVRLLVQLAVALTGQLGYAAAEVERVYKAAEALLGSEADPALLYPIMRGLATFNLVRGRLAAAHALSLQGMELAERSGRADFRIDAMSVHCYATLYYGDLAECRSWIERCLALYREHHGERLTYPVPQDAGTAALALLPTVAWLLGDAQGAEDAIAQGLAHVERLDRDFDRALMHAWIAGTRYTQRRYLEAAQHAATAVDIAGRHKYGEWHAIAGLMALLAQAALQAAPSALEQARGICEAFQKQDVGLNASYYLWALARGHAQCGNRDIAAAMLGAARHFAEASQETRMDAELLILAAELEPDAGKARALLADAVDLATRQKAVATALRAAAEWSLRGGDAAQARDARSVLDALDGRAGYPREVDWMRARLGALWKAGRAPG